MGLLDQGECHQHLGCDVLATLVAGCKMVKLPGERLKSLPWQPSNQASSAYAGIKSPTSLPNGALFRVSASMILIKDSRAGPPSKTLRDTSFPPGASSFFLFRPRQVARGSGHAGKYMNIPLRAMISVQKPTNDPVWPVGSFFPSLHKESQ
jgi:hypothetical protein